MTVKERYLELYQNDSFRSFNLPQFLELPQQYEKLIYYLTCKPTDVKAIVMHVYSHVPSVTLLQLKQWW